MKEYCLRKLGKPVIEINVADEQIDDRIDEAIAYWTDYHFDGSEKTFYKYQITQQDIDNGYIEMPQNIIGVVDIFPIGGWTSNTSNIFSLQYQIALNDLYTLTSQTMVPYYMTMQHVELMQQILVGMQPLRYNRHLNKLHIDMNWNKLSPGFWIIIEAYKVLDPSVAQDMWSDRWLLKYATQLIKKQWGTNLSKFGGMKLPGGVIMNGADIYEQAESEIEKLELEMVNSYSLPVTHFIG